MPQLPMSIEKLNTKLVEYNIQLIGNYVNGSRPTKFRCYCGQIFETLPKSIFHGRTRSCGCYQSKLTVERQLKNLIHKDFDRLYVLELLPKNGPKRKYKCRCKCGKIVTIAAGHLKSGHTRSCGCKNIDVIKNRKGINHPKYNPLLTNKEREDRRLLPEFVAWRTAIYKRDNHICQICKTKHGPFNAHHLDGWKWCKTRRFDVTNGITLCEKCHKSFHSKYGRGKNTESQFEEFKNAKHNN